MKQILSIFLATSFMLACNVANRKEKTTTTDPVAKSDTQHLEPAGGLVLNNGSKWKADSATILNVVFLKKIVSGSNNETLQSYSQLAVELQDGLKEMINECKMKGSDHEALHHWLEPLMGMSKDLKKANNIENARKIFKEIEMHINLFPKYFE